MMKLEMSGSGFWWKMRINCDHGYYSFYPESEGDLYLFLNMLDVKLVWNKDHYTYPLLKTLPNYVISPSPYGLFPSKKSFEGTPQEIMKEFNLVYNIATESLVLTEGITYSGRIFSLGKNWISETAMIQAGTIIGDTRIKSYDGIFSFARRKTILRYWE